MKRDPSYKARYNLWRWARDRAVKSGVPFSITVQDITIPDYCPVLGISMSVGQSVSWDGSPSLDRIVPSKGYVVGNVLVISRKANTIKSNATIPELLRVASFYERGLQHERTTHR